MSSISISYGLKTIKLKVTPATPTADILERAVAHFKLDPLATGLFHNDNELSKSLPFRFLNLPAGAKLALKPSKVTTKQQVVTVKVQFINFSFQPGSIVKKFDNQSSIKQVIESLEQELNVNILNQDKPVKFQSITKVMEQDQINEVSLAQFGIENNGIIRVSLPNQVSAKPAVVESRIKKTENMIKHVIKHEEKLSVSDEGHVLQKTQPVIPEQILEPIAQSQEPKDVEMPDVKEEKTPEETQEIAQHVYVYKPSSSPLPEVEVDESIYEVTVSHARQYQTMLSQKAHETLKDKKLRESKKKPITNIEVRIRFPDNTNLQVNFKPNETNQDLYNFVKNTLIKENEEFKLHLPYPPKNLSNDNITLITNLESRNLLLFQTTRKTGTFLKQEYLSQAKDLKDAEEVKQDLNRHLLSDESNRQSTDSNIHNGVLPKRKEMNTSASSESAIGGKKIPKWLKLGKK